MGERFATAAWCQVKTCRHGPYHWVSGLRTHLMRKHPELPRIDRAWMIEQARHAGRP